MAKYRVFIPKPSASRLKNIKITITLMHGWSNCIRKEHDLEKDQNEFEFEVSDEYDWKHATSVNDGDMFDVYAKYTNDKGSREEIRELVPEKI